MRHFSISYKLILLIFFGLLLAQLASSQSALSAATEGFEKTQFQPIQELASLQNIKQIVTGENYTCALTHNGSVKCWGQNEEGQLGNNSTTISPIPVDVIGLSSKIIAISAGDNHACALSASGGVKCWGNNRFGQLGNNSTVSSLVPVDVYGLNNDITAITTGYAHTCAMRISGKVKCWGNNSSGQLGNNSTVDSYIPVDVNGLEEGVSMISARSWHTCVLTMVGGVKCWGSNTSGQLGNNSTTNSNIPVDVSGLGSGVSVVSAGGDYTCALTMAREIKCWGWNRYLQLGNNNISQRSSTPVDVSDLGSDIYTISAGGWHTCALSETAGVKCWGWNYFGQLGNYTTIEVSSPVDVSGLFNEVIMISAGGHHTCALSATGRVKCWGWNSFGQLGNNIIAQNSRIPVDVRDLGDGNLMISAGNWHTCALSMIGRAKCWGDNYFGQLGTGSTNSNIPLDVTGLVSASNMVSSGSSHTCALVTTGGVKCWGDNSWGQLGIIGSTGSETPVDVSELSYGISSISVGFGHTCALTNSGGVKCWGLNASGQLGNASNIDSNTPVDVSGLGSGVSAISVGGWHSCALTSGGVKCWGLNQFGQLGNASNTSSNIPVNVSSLTNGVSAISANGDNEGSYTCALTIAGGVKCWGVNWEGQLGNGSTIWSNTPVDVSGLSGGIKAISTGGGAACAVNTTGSVRCWGRNNSGKLGNGNTDNSSVPIDVNWLSDQVGTVSLGGSHICALTNTGSVKCWGNNSFGQLGDGSAWQTTPVDVLTPCYLLSNNHNGEGGALTLSPANSPGCAIGQFTSDSAISLTASPAVGWQVASWRGTANDISTSITNTLVMTSANHSAGVIYTPICYTLTLTHTGNGSNPTAAPGNSATCPSGQYTARETVTLKVTPALGHQVSGWIGTTNNTSTTSQITLTMPAANHSAGVSYTPICYNLALHHVGSGSDPEASPVNSPGCATNHYHIGTTINLVSVPANGWRVQGWLGTSHNTSTTLTNSVTMPAAPYALTVAYQEIPLPSVGDAYEPDASCAAAQPIFSDGTTQAHTFHQTGDGDWLQFAVKAGAEYLIDVSIPPDSPADIALELFDDCAQPSLVGQDYTFSPGIRMRRKAMHDGFFWLSIVNHDAATAGEHVRYEVSVRNLSQASQPGALIIVAGKIRSNDPVDANIYYVTDAVRQVFIDHEYDDERIRYLAPDLQHANVDGLATAVNLQSAITSWAADKVDGNHALTIYLMDHGSQGYFFLDKQRSEWVTPEQLSGWLDTLEASRPGVKINVIIEACYSGSFVRKAKGLSKPGRLIITSTDAENLAYASNHGAFFSDYLLNGLRRGESLLTSFREAQLATSIAHQSQVAWMDGDGNRQSDEPEDRRIAAQRGFSFPGTLPDDIWPPYIAQVQPPQISAGRGELSADVRDDLKVADVWAVIYPPSYTPPVESEALVQESLQTIKLLDQGNGWYGASYPGFTETGLYRIVLYAEDEQQLQARPVAIEANTGGHVYLPLVVR